MQIQRDRKIVVTLWLATGLAGCSGGGSGEGFVDASFNFPKTALDGDVLAIAPAADGSGDVYIGGSFTSYDGMPSTGIVRLDPDGEIDAGFNVGAGFGNVVFPMVATIHAIAPATDGSGDIYVGGDFTSYDGSAANGIIALNADGTIDAAFHTGAGFDEAVQAIAVATDGSGDIYVSGGFYTYNGTSVRELVRLDADGTLDAAFDLAAEVGGEIAAIVPTTDGSGDVYVSGLVFYQFVQLLAYGVLRLNADGTPGAAFDVGIGPYLESGGGQALALAADGSGDVYVGGFWAYASSPPRPLITRLNMDGTLDAAFDVGTGFGGGGVHAIAAATDGSGDVYVGGVFTSYNGTPVNGIIALDADGTLDTGFDVGTGFEGAVDTIAAATDGSGNVYVGGAFTSYDATPSIHLVALDADGSIDPGFAVPASAGFENEVRAIAPARDGSGDVYVGGYFTSHNGTASNRILRVDADGKRDAGFDVGTGFSNPAMRFFPVVGIAPAMDGSGDVYVGGGFTSYNGSTANGIIRLDAGGARDAGFDAGTGIEYGVSTVVSATDGSGDVYVGGWFTSYNGTAANGIVRLDADGTLDTGFDIGTGFDGEARVIVPTTDGSGDVYVGGYFTSYDGVASNRIIRLDSDGTPDSGFSVGTGFDGPVFAIATATDGSQDVYVGGLFFSYDGTPSSAIVRIDADGTIDAAFDIGSGFDGGSVRTIVVAADGSAVYAGGFFRSYDGTTANRIIRLQADGSIDGGFDAGDGFDAAVYAIALATDGSGDVYVAGSFRSYDGIRVDRVAALNPDGSLD